MLKDWCWFCIVFGLVVSLGIAHWRVSLQNREIDDLKRESAFRQIESGYTTKVLWELQEGINTIELSLSQQQELTEHVKAFDSQYENRFPDTEYRKHLKKQAEALAYAMKRAGLTKKQKDSLASALQEVSASIDPATG